MWTNAKEISGNSGKSEKKGIPRNVLTFFQKHSTEMNSPILILSGITESSIQMVSAPVVCASPGLGSLCRFENSSLKEKQAAYLHNFDDRNDVQRTTCRR